MTSVNLISNNKCVFMELKYLTSFKTIKLGIDRCAKYGKQQLILDQTHDTH